jgi:dolichyl-phosphate beta-glucosyltransferase
MISIVVPAYNEAGRMKPFLTRLVAMLRKGNYELIVVDDGSSDDSAGISKELTKGMRRARIISYKPNRGKGYAVKTGMLAAKGDPIIFIDADGSIPPEEIPRMAEALKKYDFVVGDRSSSKSMVTQPKMRKYLGVMFNTYINMLFGLGVSDYLCGFKGFRRKAAMEIFKGLVSERWIFDVEVFYRAKKGGYSLYKMPIRWVHKEKTKIRTFDPLKMFWQALLLRLKV